MPKNNQKEFTLFEKICYPVCGALMLWGLTYTVLGLIGDNLQVASSDNYLKQASDEIAKLFGLGFFGWGLIIFSIGAVIATVVLLVYARNTDRDYEKAQRRAARLARNRVTENNETQQAVVPEEPKAE
ncbi:MAG: hypothetical protein J5880_04080 [Bacilli bacterium]|nr:hypothetical protein [Bacilli bacterium]